MAWRIVAGVTTYLLVLGGVVFAFRRGLRQAERAAEREAAKKGPRLLVIEGRGLDTAEAVERRRRGKR